jgi:hypothetical protein
MLGQCSLRHRFPVCSSGGNSNRKSSFWRLVGICVFPCRPTSSKRAKFYSSVLYAMLTGQLAWPALFFSRVITQQRSLVWLANCLR